MKEGRYPTRGGGQRGGHEDQTDQISIGTQYRAAIEAEPTEPEQEHPDSGKWHAVAGDSRDGAVGPVLPPPAPQ